MRNEVLNLAFARTEDDFFALAARHRSVAVQLGLQRRWIFGTLLGLFPLVVLGQHGQEGAVIQQLDRLGVLAFALLGPDRLRLERGLLFRTGLVGAADVLAFRLAAGLPQLAAQLTAFRSGERRVGER